MNLKYVLGGYQKVKVSFPRNGANVEYNVGKTLGRLCIFLIFCRAAKISEHIIKSHNVSELAFREAVGPRADADPVSAEDRMPSSSMQLKLNLRSLMQSRYLIA